MRSDRLGVVTTLTEFLMARIAEDEAQARDAIAERNRIFHNDPPGPDLTLESYPDAGVPFVAVGPERVLAECAAKRCIVELHQPEPWKLDPTRLMCDGCSGVDDPYIDQIPFPCANLKYLAEVYADHPDYDEAWRP